MNTVSPRPSLHLVPSPKSDKASMRLYYLRDRQNIQRKKDGKTFTRGNPVALIASEVDFAAHIIRYQVATVYRSSVLDPFDLKRKPIGDTFVKALGRRIAKERLAIRPIEIDEADVSGGRAIIRQIMIDIESNEKLPIRTRDLATEWLETPPPHKAGI
jgi:hypothetical protein